MLKIYFCTAILMVCARSTLANSTAQCEDTMPTQSYIWDDENVKKINEELKSLKFSIDGLRLRLELLQVPFDNQLHRFAHIEEKLEKLLNAKEKEAIQETSKRLSVEGSENAIKRLPSSCAEALAKTQQSGVYSIKVDSYGPQPFLVYCDAGTQGGNWTVIQRRQDGSLDFLRNWTEYKHGFGNLQGEFFLGLDKLHAITTEEPQELLILMEDFENVKKYAKYDVFGIGSDSQGYALNVLGGFSGDAGDSLSAHAASKFSTTDRDNDEYASNCASEFKGAWWYKACHTSNLNGMYLKGAYAKDKFAQGVVWSTWKGYYYSLKATQMLIRPKRF